MLKRRIKVPVPLFAWMYTLAGVFLKLTYPGVPSVIVVNGVVYSPIPRWEAGPGSLMVGVLQPIELDKLDDAQVAAIKNVSGTNAARYL